GDLDEQSSLQTVRPGKQAVVQVELAADKGGVSEPGDAQHFLHTKPESLPVLEQQRCARPDPHPAIPVHVAALRLEELAPSSGVLVQGQQVIGCQGVHATPPGERNRAPLPSREGGLISFSPLPSGERGERRAYPVPDSRSAGGGGWITPVSAVP